MENKVTVAADQYGNVIGISKNNPEYGYIRLEQQVMQFNDQGWLKKANRSALVKGKVEDLISCNYKQGQELPGKIAIVESLIPFNTNNPDYDLKIAGATGIICRIDDQPIYRQTFYTLNNNVQDTFVSHNNGDEIKDVLSAQKAMSGLKFNIKSDVTL